MTPVPLAHVFDGPEDAPVLMLASSVGSGPAMWDAQVPALAERFRVLRFDHRGHGASPVPPGPYAIDHLGADVLALLDSLGLDRVAFCGLSMGGMVGMWVASEAPERITRLALCCTSARLGPPEMWTERAAAVRGGGMASIVEAVVDRWLTPGFSAAHPDVRAHLEAMFLANPPDGYGSCCEAIAAMDLFDRLDGITAPTLVLSAEQDPATPPEHGDAIAAAIPGARHVVLPDAAHLAPVEQPAAVNAALLEHLDPGGPTMSDSLDERGEAVRREVLGDEHVDRSSASADDITREFQALITRYAWGEIWGRPGLDRRTRSIITLTALVAGGHDAELELHLRGARRNGLADAEIVEVLLQTAVYCGVPAANSAFAVAKRVLAEDPPS